MERVFQLIFEELNQSMKIEIEETSRTTSVRTPAIGRGALKKEERNRRILMRFYFRTIMCPKTVKIKVKWYKFSSEVMNRPTDKDGQAQNS